MPADYTIKQGDTLPLLESKLTYPNGTVVNLEGATVKLMVRTLAANEPLSLTGTTAITSPANGEVSFAFSAADTATAGVYMASWVATLAGGKILTYPTVGYLWLTIEESLSTPGGRMLVPLPEVKDYLSIPATDRVQDAKLLRFCEAVRPLVENITGPILPTVRREIFDGGQYFVTLRRRPSSGYGTSPVLNLIAVSEWRGPIEYPLAIIQDPAHASIYSCFLDARAGTVTRRTTGGGVISYPAMAQSVQVVYESGQSVVPANVVEGTLEIIRINYQTTQATGRGMQITGAGYEREGPALGFFIPRRARELLAPTRRAPSVW